jgi:hypothetical protein
MCRSCEQRWNRFSKVVSTSWRVEWRVDETYVSIKAKWHYLYRAVDEHGKTVDFWLRRDRGIARTRPSHRIRKGQFSLGDGRRRRGWSRKAEWAMALA